MMGGGGGHHPGPPGGQGLHPEQTNIKEKTPMCLVNELARFNKVSHQYRLTDESGPAHKKTFTVSLKIGETEEYVASGPSIKKAQHAAAAIALEKTQFKHPSPRTKNIKNGQLANVTPTVELNALAMKRGEPTTYTFLEPNRGPTSQYPPSHPSMNFRGIYNQRYHCGRSPGYPPVFCVQLRVGNREFMGEGATAQAAKHGAAGKALRVLKELPIPDGKSKLDPTSLPFVPGSEYDELKSPISLVHEVALKRNLQVHFEVTRESGPPHMRTFITKCIVGDFITDGEGNGKKVSKKRAAELMLDQLKHLPPVASAMQPKPRKPLAGKKKSRNLIKESVEQKENPDYGQSINPISRLIQIQQARKEKEPQYSLIAETGMPRRREFVMSVTVGQHSTTGSGPNKKLAKRAAAEALLQLLGYSRPTPQPNKPALKSPGAEGGERNKKLTFVDEVKPPENTETAPVLAGVQQTSSGHVTSHGQQTSAGQATSHGQATSQSAGQGSASRQLVPGLLYIDDK